MLLSAVAKTLDAISHPRCRRLAYMKQPNTVKAWCRSLLKRCRFNWAVPNKTHLILITDLYEGGDCEQLLARAA